MNEYKKLDALYQRDQGVSVPYLETDTNVGYKPHKAIKAPIAV